MTDDIAAFIKIRLHEDQMSALDALKHWPPGDEIAGQVDSILVGAHIQRQNPQRTLRGVEAKRRLVDDLLAQDHFSNDRDWYGCQSLKEGPGDGPDVPTGRPCTCGRDEDVERRLRLIALEWSTHEDYRSEWTP